MNDGYVGREIQKIKKVLKSFKMRRYEIVLCTDENLTVLTTGILKHAAIKKITEYNEKGEPNILCEEKVKTW